MQVLMCRHIGYVQTVGMCIQHCQAYCYFFTKPIVFKWIECLLEATSNVNKNTTASLYLLWCRDKVSTCTLLRYDHIWLWSKCWVCPFANINWIPLRKGGHINKALLQRISLDDIALLRISLECVGWLDVWLGSKNLCLTRLLGCCNWSGGLLLGDLLCAWEHV